MGNNPIQILCYADDAVLIADSEKSLQTLLLKFDQMAESLNMEISLSKTKSLTISRNNMKCEVKLKGTTIEQVPKFNYLGAEISAKRTRYPIDDLCSVPWSQPWIEAYKPCY